MATGGGPSLEIPSIPNHSLLRASVIPTLLDCIVSIGDALRSSSRVSLVGTANAFGDDQLNVDVVAERIIRTEIASKCPCIVTASSEEEPIERAAQGEGKQPNLGDELYTIAFDPLDGSSIIAPNWTVGTIIGIWAGSTALQQNSEKQLAAILGVYGPRTTAVIAVRASESTSFCVEAGLGEQNSWEIVRSGVKLLEGPSYKTRYFAPANLRASAEDERYAHLIAHYMKERYTLRYSGGLVPDIIHTLVKGHGIYLSPVTTKSKAKLRRLYELAPIALIIECAGGSAINPTDGTRILAKPIEHCDERAGIICGTTEEVDLVKRSFDI